MSAAKGILSPRFTLRHIILPLMLAVIVVTAVLGIREFVLIVWGVLLFAAVSKYQRQNQRARAILALTTEVLIGVLVITLAARAPGKTKDRVLDRPVVLPKLDLTLGELRQLAEEGPHAQRIFPVYLSFSRDGTNSADVVRFRGRVMPLRHFVSEIESQTSLRHRFRSCGNGHTILWGEDCCFGLSLR